MSASRERSANTSQSDSEDEEPLTKAKLFALADNGHWAEMGVGVAWVAEQPANTTTTGGASSSSPSGANANEEEGGPYMTLNISSLDEKGVVDMNDLLMSTTVMPDEEYKVQRHSILLWSDPRLDGKDMAISFHSRAGCDSIVDSISKYQQKMRDAAAASRAATSSSPTSATAERGEDEVNPQGAGGGDSSSSSGGGMKRSVSNAGSSPNNNATARQNTVNQAQANSNNVARQRQLANSNSSSWAVEKQNLQFLADASMSSRHRFGCEVRDRRSFVYDICNLFVVAVHDGDVHTIDLICNIVVNCLTFFSAEVHVITQFVEEKTVEAVIDVVQFYLGRRTKESGFESRNERQQAFRNPAKFPPWLVSRVHYFYAIQYLRDLIPHKLEAAADGDQSLVNLFLLRARLNMVHELFRRPAPTCPDGAQQPEASSSPARATASTDVIHEDGGSEDDSTTQINPPQRNASLTEPSDPDRSLLEQGMMNAHTMEDRRGVAALIHDITYNIKFNSAYGLEVRNDVFSNLVKCEALDFLSNLLRDELAETALNGDDIHIPTSTPHHNNNPSSRASSHRAGSSKRPSHQQQQPTSITSSQSVRFIADIISHIAVWAPNVVCGWLLEDAKKPILMPASQLRALAPPPPMLARSSTLVDPPGESSTFATPPRSPVAPTSNSTDDLIAKEPTSSGGGMGVATTTLDVSEGRDRTVSVHDYDGDASMEPASPLDVGMHQHLQSSSSIGSSSTTPATTTTVVVDTNNATPTSMSADVPNNTTTTSNEEEEEVMSPTVHHPPTTTAEDNTTTPLRNVDGVSPSPIDSSSSREPGNTPQVLSSTPSTNATTPTTAAAAATTTTPGGGVMGLSSPRTVVPVQPKPFGRSLLFLLVEALGIVSNPIALQALVDAVVACGIGLVQNSTAPSIFGTESAALRVRVLQYWVTGCCTISSGLSPLPALYVPLFHALKAASFDASTACTSLTQHEKAESRSLQALRLLRILGREKALIASVPFFNAVKDSGVVTSIKLYFDACRLAGGSGASRATSTATFSGHNANNVPTLVLPSSTTTTVKEQMGHKRERSPSSQTKTESIKQEEDSEKACGGDAVVLPPTSSSLSSTQVAPFSSSSTTTLTTAPATASSSSPPQMVIVSKQLLSAMCAFLGVLISFNTEEVDTYLVESGVLASLVEFRRTLRPGGSMVSAGILSVFAATPAAFREGKERPGGLSSMASAAIADITRSPYVNTIENSNQNQGASLTGVMSSGSTVLLAYVYGAFEEYLIKEAPTLLRTIARALEGKQDDDVCSSVSNVSSFYAGAGGSANQEAFEAELAVLKSEGGHFLHDDPPITGVLGGGLGGGGGGGSDEDSFGKLSVDDAIAAAAEDDDDDDNNVVSTRSSSSNHSGDDCNDCNDDERTVDDTDTNINNSPSSSTSPDRNDHVTSESAEPQQSLHTDDGGSNTVGVVSSPQKAEAEEETNTTPMRGVDGDDEDSSDADQDGRNSIGSSICGDSLSSSAANSTSLPVPPSTTLPPTTTNNDVVTTTSEVAVKEEVVPEVTAQLAAVVAAEGEAPTTKTLESELAKTASPKKPVSAPASPASSPAAASSPPKSVLGSPPK